MRSLSGTRNRIALTVAGLLTLAVAAWLVAEVAEDVEEESEESEADRGLPRQ